ncbi:hypothetical protein SAMN04487941_2523 [Pontibacter akesuensis]|uniref:Uncharacterized protein n=2 Tax=Pontibacter akesuensis TaxID=388950 RepID=A0A1I7J613_9BACT|nr:hypothetical protein SAMN04487941_2523 [Pontibacter akesuensis]
MTFSWLLGLDECNSLKTGVFKMTNEVEGSAPITSVIERTGEFQYERVKELGLEIKYKVEWVNDCTYKLVWLETIKDENNFGYPTNQIITNTITEVTPEYYIIISSSNLFEEKFEGKVEIVKR